MKHILAIALALASSAFCIEVTTPRPMVECNTQNCIVSFSNMDDGATKTIDEMIGEDQTGILALKFSSCSMQRIPNDTFERLPSLLALMITEPGVKALEYGDFLGASNLQFLYIPGNRIERLLAKTFAGASNLNDINLSDNAIEVVSEDAFATLEHVESLNLSRNRIAFFGQSTFAPLADLVNLDISGNALEFLDARLFATNSKLNGINLADNQIVSITDRFMEILPQVKVLSVVNNPCANDTALEAVPLVKVADSRGANSEDEGALEKCYRNFRELADPESTDFFGGDLLDRAEIAREDIEADIIADLTEQLRERDVTIKELERQDDLIKIGVLLVLLVAFFFGILRLIMYVVNSTYQGRMGGEKEVEVVRVDPKQIVYTIEV